ncbi:MAG: MFS transporter [Gammaproteobacteria bacterium]|nr:MFS transporter [Gammaproteobacteria bacterium]
MTHSYRSAIPVYAAGVLQGAAFVLVPALGRVLEAPPYRLDAAAYGALYFPEILGAVIGALLAGRLHRRRGAAAVLRSGLAANALGMAVLALASLMRGEAATAAILLETACLGIGFGLTLASLNPAAAVLFPRAPTAAITTLNGAIGVATALAPLGLELARRAGAWGAMPAALAVGFVALLLAGNAGAPEGPVPAPGTQPHRLWRPFIIAVALYAIAEGSFSSWAQVYLVRIGHADAARGALALSGFWGAMTVLRLALGVVPERGAARRRLLLASALAIGASFLLLAQLHSAATLVAGFAIAGAACGIYYPYAMAFGLASQLGDPIGFAGSMVAALMIGEGLGSFAPGELQRFASLPALYAGAAALALPLAFYAWRLPRLCAETSRPGNHAGKAGRG